MNRRRICAVTGSRADYSHLRPVMFEIRKDPQLRLQVVVTGMHLAKNFGLTFRAIEKDGFRIDAKVNVLRYSDSEEGIAKSVGLACSLFASVFRKLKPEVILLLGDRFEIFGAAIAAYVARIPLAHIHGGETSQGAMDEAFRHAITKMACLHFAATESYRKRIIQLGENPKLVFNYGAPGLDNIRHSRFLDRNQLAEALDFDLNGQVAIVTYHPVTLENGNVKKDIGALLKVLDGFDGKIIFTQTNADTHGNIITQRIRQFCRSHVGKCKWVQNMGQRLYLSCLKHFDLMIGNSSSGIVEAPSFSLPVINIGDRQKGRTKAKNVIDVRPSVEEIKQGIRHALSDRFRKELRNMKNPYSRLMTGIASRKIKEKLKAVVLEPSLIKKQFFDLPVKY